MFNLSLHMLTAYLLTALFCGIAHSLPLSSFEATLPTGKVVKAGPSLHSDPPGPHHRRLAARNSSLRVLRYKTRYPDVAKRTETPGGLFGDNGIPDLADVEQSKCCIPIGSLN
jgi:hypothetical protein